MADGDAPAPGYASDPTLSILWGPPPGFTGDTGGGSATSASAAPEHNPFSVALASLHAAETSMLDAAKAIVEAYNPLETKVQTVIHDAAFYGQQATYEATHPTQDTNGSTTVNWNTPGGSNGGSITVIEQDTQLQEAAVKFAATMNPVMTRVLRMVADGAVAAGVFIALLDKSGQAYSAADRNSFFPVPTGPTGTDAPSGDGEA